MINDKARAILKLRTIINDTAASPHRRIQSAVELLARFGPSKRAVPLIKSIIRTFEDYQDASLAKQKAVRTAVEQLEQNLKLALRTQAAQKDLVDEDDSIDDAAPSPELADAVPIDSSEIGGLELLPNPSDEHSWCRFLLSIGRNPRLSKTELLSSIDIPLWIGERETTGRSPVNLARPPQLQYHIADSEIDWTRTVDLAVEATPAARAAYRAESAALIHSRLINIGITPEGYISIPDLIVTLDAAYASLRPPYVTFERVNIESPWLDPDADSRPAVKLTLTGSGEKKRFINLIRSRLRQGFDVYGKRSIGPVVNNLVVAQGDSICSPQIK